MRWLAVLVLVLLVTLPGAAQAESGCPVGLAGWEVVQRGWDRIPGGEQTFGNDLYRIEVRHRRDRPDGGSYDLVDVMVLDPGYLVRGVCIATGVGISTRLFKLETSAVRLETQGFALRVRVW